MAVEYKIIKIRAGLEADLDTSRLLPRELAIATDSGKMWFCYSAGNVREVATNAITGDALPFTDTNSFYPTDEVGDALVYLGAKLSENVQKINDIGKPIINEFRPLRILVSGDSITDPLYTASKKWPAYLAEWFGFAVLNDGKSSTGLIRANGEIPGLFTRIDTWDTTHEDFDMILIMGNMNDGGIGPSTFPVGNFTDTIATASQYGALHATIQKLLTKYPNKPIGWIISTPRLASTSYPAPHNGKAWGTDSWFEPYCQAILKVCDHYSIPCLDLYHNSGLRPYNAVNNVAYFDQADGVHPNNKGHEIMAYKIYDFVKAFMGGNVNERTAHTFEAGAIESYAPPIGSIGYSAVTARARMGGLNFGVYKPGTFIINEPSKYNLAIFLFSNNVSLGNFLGNTISWSATQRMSMAGATHYKIAMKKMDGTEFTATELLNMNRMFTFIPD